MNETREQFQVANSLTTIKSGSVRKYVALNQSK